ncbi:MAG TPA: magnesium and cobalt transport protein CorA [Acidimicrobiia bacterium]|nr:magnesium and cobalt transport protein CorA [Acidimicrobiia bacterium]
MIVDAAIYKNGHRLEEPFSFDHAHKLKGDPETCVWVGLHEPTKEEFEAARDAFGLHELAVEDAVKAHQRPKLETYGQTLFLVTKPARYVDPVEIIEFGEILLFVDPDFVVAVRHGEASQLVEVRHELEADPERLALGPGSVLHAILNRVVRDYTLVLDALGDDVREVEEEVFSTGGDLERIYRLKQEVMSFQNAAQPLEEPLFRLSTDDFAAIHPSLKPYFRDVHDHLLRVVDRINAFSDMLSSILAANLTQVSLRQNEDMRKISAYVAIAAIPTLLAGIWGMNFTFMPEIDERWGYPLALGIMASVCLFLYSRFKKSGWL